METFRKKIQQMTGWSDTIVNTIQSEAEARIYIGAGLKETTVNGKPALIQPRIDHTTKTEILTSCTISGN